MSIKNITTSLQNLLEVVNSLPEVGSEGIELPELTNEGASSDLLSGKQLIDSDGNVVTGTIESKSSSDLDVSGATVTVPAGYYASNVTKSVDTVAQAEPIINIGSDGKINVSVTQTSGYVIAGTKSATKQLTTQGTKTITPTKSSQTAVPSGVYTTGAVTVAEIPTEYIIPSGTLNIIEGGQHDVTEYASVNVNIFGGSSGVEDTRFKDYLEGTMTEIYDESVTKVKTSAFYSEDTITSIRFPNVTSIGSNAFRSCTALETVDLPNLTGVLPTFCCDACSSLKYINAPKSTGANNYSFRNCSSLEKIDFGSNTTTIGSSSFNGASALTIFIIRRDSKVPSLTATNAFTNTPIASGTGYIYVPSALVDSYKTATNWSTYANQIRAIEDYPEICAT